MKIIKQVLLLFCSSLLIACMNTSNLNKKSVASAEIHVHIFADENINRDILDIPSPTRIYILELSNILAFEQLTEPDLHDENEYIQNLKPSIIDKNQFIIRPKEVIDFKLNLKENTQYLGLIAEYRDLSTLWKLPLKKQELKWFHLSDPYYLYIQLNDKGIQQLSREQAIIKIASIQLEKTGETLDNMTDKAKKDLLNKIDKSLEQLEVPKANLEKGIFIAPSQKN